MPIKIRRSWIFTCLLVLVLSGVAWSGGALQKVRWVNDGDTIVLSNGARVRYIGIDAPETAHDNRPAERYGPEARTFNRKLVLGERVRLELDAEHRDQYGRILAYIFLEDGTFVNEALLKRGFAHYVFKAPNTRYDQRLLIAQREAMAKRAGLWKRFQNKPGPYIGNTRSKRFHRPTCPFGKQTSPRNVTSLKDRYSAFWAGYSPCAKCQP